MDKVLRCDCGFEVGADTDDELVAAIRRHALDAHGIEFTRDDALRVAFRAELAGLVAPDASQPSREE
jgi:predicted small metal-binding protein